jgi:acylphosphatase
VVRRHVVVRGRVQGVGYRMSLASRAQARGVGGWVRNLHDGSVEAVLEGEAEAVESVLDWCRDGPRGARVDAVDIADEEPEGLTFFEVR